MKRTILLLAAIITMIVASAQDTKDYSKRDKDRGFTVGILFGLTYNHETVYPEGGPGEPTHYHRIGTITTPRIGYRFNSGGEIGAMFRYERYGENQKHYGIGLYVEKSLFHFNPGFTIFLDLQAYHSFVKLIEDPKPFKDLKKVNEIGFVPGIRYHIPNTPVDIKLRYLFIGLNDVKDKEYDESRNYVDDAPGCWEKGGFMLDASLRRLEIGASVTF